MRGGASPGDRLRGRDADGEATAAGGSQPGSEGLQGQRIVIAERRAAIMRQKTAPTQRRSRPSPSVKRHTGMPSFFALSARLAEMPEPGNTTTPIGSASSIRSLRLKGAALLCRVQSGLKRTCGTLRLSAQQAAMRSAPRGLPPCSSTMSGCLARILSSASQMRVWSLHSMPPVKAMRAPAGAWTSVSARRRRRGSRGCRSWRR